MRKWTLAAALGAAVLVPLGLGADATTTSSTLNFENAAVGNVSLVYTADGHGPIAVWGFDSVKQIPVQVSTVSRNKVLGVATTDTCKRIHVGLGTACESGAAFLHSFRIIGTTAPVDVFLFDRGGNVGPTGDGMTIPATGANGSTTVTFSAGTTGLLDDAVAQIAICFDGTDGYVDDFVFECGSVDPCTPPPTASTDDWFTGGGWIYGTPSGLKGTFSIGGGKKNGKLWGHMNFIDHATMMHAHWKTITSYTVLAGTRRRVTGTCVINGAPGTFVAEVEDNGEPGRADVFQLSLSNGYFASGTLDGGGNIQLHKATTKGK